tara:strand:- start:7 stop:285 length:279 start_codon:yes stop_codon:yes gene_type:complete
MTNKKKCPYCESTKLEFLPSAFGEKSFVIQKYVQNDEGKWIFKPTFERTKNGTTKNISANKITDSDIWSNGGQWAVFYCNSCTAEIEGGEVL